VTKKEKILRPSSLLHPLTQDSPRVGVGILVIHKDAILLGKRLSSLGKNTWGPPGGHLEHGETLEQCTKRELVEETGLTAKNISRGGWTSNIIQKRHYITLWAHVNSFSGIPTACEADKCASWKWFSLDNLPSPLFPSFVSYQNHIQSLSLTTNKIAE